MLLPVPVAISVESNIFAPAPTRSAFPFAAVTMKRQRRIIPVNVPMYEDDNDAEQSTSVPTAAPPPPAPNPLPAEHLKNVPLAVANPEPDEEQSVNVPDAIPPNELFPAEHLLNIPLAVPTPNDSIPAEQSSNKPDAIAAEIPEPAYAPPKELLPPTHLR